MPEVKYGDQTIEYTILEKPSLKWHYISVERDSGVILKGKLISEQRANQFVLKKAKWILKKMEVVKAIHEGDIVTGSRIPYLGKKYYVEVYHNKDIATSTIEFNHSRFKVVVNPQDGDIQEQIKAALDRYYLEKASEKLPPRIKKWANRTGHNYNLIKFRKQKKRWGSCTPKNDIIINTEAMKLPYTLIDYLIVHEICHTRIKNHSKEFWAEVSKNLPNWKELDERMGGMRL